MIISRKIEDLEPELQIKARAWLEQCKHDGINPLIYCTYRDDAAQDWLYASGRTREGKILTNAKAGQSQHNFRKAFDFVLLEAGKALWKDEEKYTAAGVIGEKLGLSWSGRWRGKLREVGHLEVK